jgi:hypothetical protein
VSEPTSLVFFSKPRRRRKKVHIQSVFLLRSRVFRNL